jgi:hypothetical protein
LGDILGDEVDFFGAGLGEETSFFEDSFDRFAGVITSEARDGAEGAAVVAPFADFKIGTPGFAGTGAGIDFGPSMVGWFDIDPWFVVGKDALDQLVENAHLPNSDIGVGSRGEAGKFVAESLGQASGDDDFAVAFLGDGLADGGDGFLFSGFEESAGVDDGDVGGLGAIDLMAGVAKDARDFFAIDLVFGASEGDDAYISVMICH